jgi:light-regulated signal transduction histidine kinase (bacteriophytochrome)
VSHDLRAPLRHLSGYAELLRKNASSTLDEKSHRYLMTISESAKRMGNLIDDLLAFSRVGRSEMQKAKVSLEQLVKGILHDLQDEMNGRNIVWEIGALPEVYGDRSMLRLVLVNLISNALKFTRTRAQAKIEIGSITGKEDEIVFFIRDNGVGFDMRYVDKLFGVFQRLHRAEEFEGTGIGLASVQRIIHRHGGRTWAEGEVDGGATFYFSVPKS